MDDRHGKGEYAFYGSGRIEIGQYVNDSEEGEHKCYDTQGNMTVKHYKDGEEVEE